MLLVLLRHGARAANKRVATNAHVGDYLLPDRRRRILARRDGVGHFHGVQLAALPCLPMTQVPAWRLRYHSSLEINPRTRHVISSKKVASRPPRLTLDRPVWLTIRAPVNVRRGGRKGIGGGAEGRMRSNLGRILVRGLSTDVVFGGFDAFTDRGCHHGRNRWPMAVPTDAPDRDTCSAMLRAMRAAFRLDLFASESLLETPGVGPNACALHLFSHPRASCELVEGGLVSRGGGAKLAANG